MDALYFLFLNKQLIFNNHLISQKVFYTYPSLKTKYFLIKNKY